MLTHLRIDLTVEGVPPNRREAVLTAARQIWDWSMLAFRGEQSVLCGQAVRPVRDETCEGLVDELCRAIWRASGSYCRIVVETVLLRPEPLIRWKREEAAYRQFAERRADDPSTDPGAKRTNSAARNQG